MNNVVASVLAKLRNNSRSSGSPFQQVLQLYAMERFLYRISKSEHAQSVILKGALLLKTIGIPRARPTVDIDMLRQGEADQASLVALVKNCATLEVEADGITFLPDSVVAEEITKNSEYQGTRIRMDTRMDNVRLKIQIDFGVGDVMVPGPRMIEYPVFLRQHNPATCLSSRVRNCGEASGDGVAWQCQQPNEGLLRRLDMLEPS
jgi:hypothetical protein